MSIQTCHFCDVGLAFHEELMELVTRLEADNFKKFIRHQCETILPGISVELCGGFKRYTEPISGSILKIVNTAPGYLNSKMLECTLIAL